MLFKAHLQLVCKAYEGAKASFELWKNHNGEALISSDYSFSCMSMDLCLLCNDMENALKITEQHPELLRSIVVHRLRRKAWIVPRFSNY